jgi:PAS domain S-box-containing protein
MMWVTMPHTIADEHGNAGPPLRRKVAELEAENARLHRILDAAGIRADVSVQDIRGLLVSRTELAGAEELISGLQQANRALDKSRADLGESEARYRAVLESAKEYAIITLDRRGKVTGWSPGATAVLGWEGEAVIGHDIKFIWTKEDREAGKPEAERRTALRNGQATDERWHLRRDGSRFWGSGQTTLLQQGGVTGFLKIMRDDTARRRALEATRDSEARLSAIFGAAAVGLCEISPKGSFLRVNEELCRILGRSRQELQRMGVADVTHPDDLEKSIRILEEVLETKSMGRLDKRYLRPDGSLVWANSSISALLDEAGEVRSLLVVTADLTERHAAEAAVRESEDRLRNLVSASSEVMYATNPDWTEMRRLDGQGLFADADQPGGAWLEYYVHPDDKPMVRSAIREGILSKSVIEMEHRVRRADGGWGWALSRAVPMMDASGEIREWFGSASDVTARKDAEAALLEQKERFRLLVLGMPQLVWRSANDGLWTWSSPQWRSYTGQSMAESLGQGWLDAVHPDDRGLAMQAWHEAPYHGKLHVEFRIRCAADGGWRWHRTRSLPVREAPTPRDPEGRIAEWVGTSTEIEDLMRLQHQQEVLVAELQHRTRNLLTVIRSILSRTLQRSADRDEFDGRLAALGRVQSFLGRTSSRSVSLAELVTAELAATGNRISRRAIVAGPPVELSDDKVQPLALALHELATNAVKYGALAQPAATLSVTWRIENREGKEHLLLEWRESGVDMPPATSPPRQGFGTELIKRSLPYQLRGKADLIFARDGVRCLMTLPGSVIQRRKPEAERAEFPPVPSSG